jgi:hypothetical protein
MTISGLYNLIVLAYAITINGQSELSTSVCISNWSFFGIKYIFLSHPETCKGVTHKF